MNLSRYLVVIPAYNESKNITQVLKGIREECPDVDILVVNDCSKDNTEQVVKNCKVKVISHCSNLGYSGAIMTGYKYALRNDYQYVIQFDGDGQHDPGDIHKLIEKIDSENCDIVIGSRFLQKMNIIMASLGRSARNFFSQMIRLFTKTTITDPTSGLQILNRRAMKYYSVSGNFPDYPDANVITLMLRIGFDIQEIPATMHDRLSGVGMHESPVNNVKYMVSMFYSIILFLLKGSNKNEVSRYGI